MSPSFLIVKMGALGDLFFALPAVSYLKQLCPDAKIDWMVSDSLAPVLEGHPEINQLISVDAKALYQQGFSRKFQETRRLRKSLSHYDHIFILHRSSSYLAITMGHGSTSIMSRDGDFRFFSVTGVHCPSMQENESLSIQRIIKAGLREFFIRQKASQDLISLENNLAVWKANTNYLRNEKIDQHRLSAPVIGLHVGGGQNEGSEMTLKQWPHWFDLIEKIIAGSRAQICLFGSKDDILVADDILTKLGKANPASIPRVQNLVGKTDLKKLIGLIAQCDVFVGPDSGPLHIADVMEVPCVGLFGPTSPISWGLMGEKSKVLQYVVPCQPCYQDDGRWPICENQKQCMNFLTSEKVFSSMREYLKPQA